MRLTPWKAFGLLAGLAAFALIAFIDSPLHHHGAWGSRPAMAAAVTSLMAIWWLTEALPITVTACVPLVLFPLTGVFGGFLPGIEASARPYAHPTIFLFMGGMGMAAAMQQWDLHRRIALTVMSWIGTDPKRILLGVIVSTAFISMWISNTATATMMVPIGLAVIAQCERGEGRRLTGYGASIMLAVAYGANVGGIGTKIGTAPNAQFSAFMAGLGIEIGFLPFMAVGVPFILLFLPVVWWVLWRVGRVDAPAGEEGAAVVRREIEALGPVKQGERVVLTVFLAAAALWIVGSPLTAFLKPRIGFMALSTTIFEGVVSMSGAILLMFLGAGGRRALELKSLKTVPWGTLVLLGGSFAMAAGIEKSGLSGWLGARLSGLREVDPFLQVLMASVAAVALSAVASNTATIQVMMSVLREAVTRSQLTTVLFAATISSSCDFALPAGTPPNAIVFGSGYLTVPKMAKTGVLLDLLAALLSAGWCWVVVRWVL